MNVRSFIIISIHVVVKKSFGSTKSVTAKKMKNMQKLEDILVLILELEAFTNNLADCLINHKKKNDE